MSLKVINILHKNKLAESKRPLNVSGGWADYESRNSLKLLNFEWRKLKSTCSGSIKLSTYIYYLKIKMK